MLLTQSGLAALGSIKNTQDDSELGMGAIQLIDRTLIILLCLLAVWCLIIG